VFFDSASATFLQSGYRRHLLLLASWFLPSREDSLFSPCIEQPRTAFVDTDLHILATVSPPASAALFLILSCSKSETCVCQHGAQLSALHCGQRAGKHQRLSELCLLCSILVIFLFYIAIELQLKTNKILSSTEKHSTVRRRS